MRKARILSCTCCGKGLRDMPEENVCYAQVPYPQDDGFGQCVECFGDSSLEPETEEEWRKFFGTAMSTIFDNKIRRLEENLSPKNVEKLHSMEYWQKCRIVQQMLEEGAIV
jgi:hypothetical protein